MCVCVCVLLSMYYENDFITDFLQTSHLRKFLEFRVGMGIMDNIVAKCKSVIGMILASPTRPDQF